MLFQLLPFFLAVQTSVMNNTWNYGPEYTFSGHAKMLTSLNSDEGRLFGNKLIFDLKCRPRTNDTLSCWLKNEKIAKTFPKAFDASASELTEEYEVAGVMNEPFDIRFNEQGIESYVIEQTDPPLPCSCLDMARLISNQLHIGASSDEIGTSNFRRLENFTIGECEVDFSVKRKPGEFVSSEEENSEEENRNRGLFELKALGNLGELQNETIEITKTRDVNDCLVCTNYFFGTRYIYGLVYRNVLTKLKASASRLSVSKTRFVSETENLVELFNEDRKQLGNVIDYMMLTLKSVLPANEALPDMINPVDMEVIANRASDSS